MATFLDCSSSVCESRLIESADSVTSNISVDALWILSTFWPISENSVCTSDRMFRACASDSAEMLSSDEPFNMPFSTWPYICASRPNWSAAPTAWSPPLRMSDTRRSMRSASSIWREAMEIWRPDALRSVSTRTISSMRCVSCGILPLKSFAVSVMFSTSSERAWILSAASRTGFHAAAHLSNCSPLYGSRPSLALPSRTALMSASMLSRVALRSLNASRLPDAAAVATFEICCESTWTSVTLAMAFRSCSFF